MALWARHFFHEANYISITENGLGVVNVVSQFLCQGNRGTLNWISLAAPGDSVYNYDLKDDYGSPTDHIQEII